MENDPYKPDSMKFETSDKTSSFGKKPHIKKGYYPAKLMKVAPYKDRDDNWKEGKFGRQLIFEFAIYSADPESGAPIKPIQHENSETGKMEDVIIPKFVYHQYKQKDKETEKTRYVTAITPNSAITKILKSLGWVFSGEGVDMAPLIGNWVEVNVDDYDYKYQDEEHTASTIKDVGEYEGPAVGEETKEPPEAKKKDPQKIEKQVKHKAVEEEAKEKEEPKKEEKPLKSGDTIPEDLEAKKIELKKLLDEEVLSKEGYEQAIAQIDAKLKDVKE